MKNLIVLIFLSYELLIAQTADTVYMPLNENNRWQYLLKNEYFGTYTYNFIEPVIQAILIGDTIYHRVDFDYFIQYYFYSVPEKKLYVYDDGAARLNVDFNIPNGTSYLNYFGYITSQSGVETLFGIPRLYGGYWYESFFGLTSYKYTDSIGLSYKSMGSIGTTSNVYRLIGAIIYYDSLGSKYYSEGYKPSFQVTPLTTLNSNVFDLSFLVTHHYTDLTGLNFIDDVIMRSYYSNGDSIIHLSDIPAVQNGLLNYRVITSLDTLLLKNGYSFYYRFTATDKCIVPGISNAPDTGYYECKWAYRQSFIEPGNRWDYIEGWWNGLGGGEADSNSYYASVDTMLQNGKTYNKILPENELFSHYLRADTAGVWYYDSGCNDEWLYFSYGDSVGQERFVPGAGCDTMQFPISITKTEDSLAFIFGETLRIMSFNVLIGIDAWYSVTISPDLGFIHWYSSSFSENYYKHLLGCEIGGNVHGTLLVSVEDLNSKFNYSLDQNYPNPFNPSTSISYSIPENSTVVIKVFDILGNEIETVVNEEKPAGNYELTWNAAGLPSGVYFYQLRAGSYSAVKKMILLR